MNNIEKIIELILKDADEKDKGGIDTGERSIYIASKLRNDVKFYQYGLQGIIPPEWIKYEKQTDEEYEEYLRLKNKFKN